MAIEIRRAQRRRARLRMALVGPTGSGKTYSALRLAFGIGQKIGLIDTERGSGDLYAHLGQYDIITLEAPFSVPRYREAIQAFERAGYDVIIIDSLSHAWAGEGGLLEKQGQLEASGRFKNSFASWREITPEQNKLIAELLQSPAHIIATMRSKTEYVIDKDDRGKSVPRKIGLSPVQRDGVEYEFTLVMDINDNHYASASKDRTGLFDGWSDRINEKTGQKLLTWLEEGDAERVVLDSAPEADAMRADRAAPPLTKETPVDSGPKAAPPKLKPGDLASPESVTAFLGSVKRKYMCDDGQAGMLATDLMHKVGVKNKTALKVKHLEEMMKLLMEAPPPPEPDPFDDSAGIVDRFDAAQQEPGTDG